MAVSPPVNNAFGARILQNTRQRGLTLSGIAGSALLFLEGGEGHISLYALMRRVGYAVCHQLPSHSYAAHGVLLPLCARCTGQYLGALVMLVATLWLGGRTIQRFPARSGLALLGGLVVIWAVDGVNSYLDFLGLPHAYTPRNVLRLMTGVGEGVALMALFWPLFAQATWPTQDGARVRGRDLVLVLAVSYGLALLIHVTEGSVRYMLGLAAAGGVLVIMAMLFSVFLRLLTNRAGRASSGWERLMFLAGGLALAVGVIAGVGALRDVLLPV